MRLRGLGSSLHMVFLISLCAVFGYTCTASAKSVARFFKNKSVILLIPSGPGGGYDRYGRLVGRHISHFLPGNPTIVPQNMPGAGGVVAANYLANVAPKDGTEMAIIQNGIPFKPLLDNRHVRFKVSDFRFLGSVTPAADIGVVRADSSIRSIADLFTKKLDVGASGGTTTYLPLALNRVLGTKFKLIKGYKGTRNILLAMERDEVGGLVGIDWTSFKGSVKGQLSDFRVIFQLGTRRNKDIKNVPLIMDAARSRKGREILKVLFASFSIGRSFVVPVIPRARLRAFRTAFKKMISDKGFRRDAKKVRAEVNPVSPAQIRNIIKAVYAEPRSIIRQARLAIATN